MVGGTPSLTIFVQALTGDVVGFSHQRLADAPRFL
jgi:hypothetical protein